MKKSLLILVAILPAAAAAFGQGTIYGKVTNADMTNPANGELSFYGYLDDTDDEIRIETSIGAGYDSTYWFDDFQNYLSEAPGNPYDFHFFNLSNGEDAVLSGIIPSNSFQREDVQLTVSSWPEPPGGFDGALQTDSTVRLTWDYSPDHYYRLYRRLSSSQGSFFRIDDPSGDLADPGVADSAFINDDVEVNENYDYMVISVFNGISGQHSEIISVSTTPESYVCGDVNGDGVINLLDINFLINFIYKGGPAPVPLERGNVDGLPGINLKDITLLINFIYKSGQAPVCL
jgi:hypothetical protein